MDETGECGVLLIDTALSPVAPVFLPTARRCIHAIPVDASVGDLRTVTEAAVAGIPASDLVRIELVGGLSPDAPRPDLARLAAAFENRFYYFEIKDSSRIAINPEDYKHDMSLKGEFIRTVSADNSLDEETKERIIACGINALMGEELFEG
jgi:hypothetical protein